MLLQRSNLIITRLALNKNSRAMLRNRGNKMSYCYVPSLVEEYDLLGLLGRNEGVT
jgi:hypothetical protein